MVRHHIDLKRELEALKQKAEGVFRHERRLVGGRLFELRPGAAVRLGDAVAGEEVAHGGGAFYRVLTDASAVWPDAEDFYREYLETLASPSFSGKGTLERGGALGSPAVSGAGALEVLRPLTTAKADRVCYLDIETTGLSMAPLFLIGLMYAQGERLVVDQLFARDYSEEETVLRFLGELMPRFDILVTFNGITFDVPFIQERMTIHRLSFSPPAVHIDLLPLARSVVGGRTPNHRLQTLEMHLCKRKRVGDISGAEIPDAYHDFVRTGDAKDMANIFHHNRLDLVTMLQLVTVFLSGER
jgi:uncharacterized protein YprB with RNaseH-like and TPR domain